MALKQITPPVCLPVSLAEARKHLAVDASDRSNDVLINLLIESATSDAQMKTGRVWVESEWEWTPESTGLGESIEFPIVPVVDVALYDLTPKPAPVEPEEPAEPTDPEEPVEPEPEQPEEPDSGDNNEPESREGEDGEAELEKPEEPDTDLPIDSAPEPPAETDPDEPAADEPVNLASEYFQIEYPSPDPMGYPAIGSLTILKALPEKFQLVLKAGYPVKESLIPVEQNTSPELVLDKTAYLENMCRLVFNRPVSGNINVRDFEFRVKVKEPEQAVPARQGIEGEKIDILGVEIVDGGVNITLPDGALIEGAQAQVSFLGGSLEDAFGNFVQPLVFVILPEIKFTTPDELPNPEPVPCEVQYESECPTPVKNWILTRVGSLYTQRTEIALRSGKSNDAMFPEGFINNLLNPYRVRWL